MKLNPKTANILFVVLIIVVLGFIAFTVAFMLNYKDTLTNNPFVYGAKKMGLGDCSCQCYNDVDTKPISFYFNQTSFSQGNGGLTSNISLYNLQGGIAKNGFN